MMLGYETGCHTGKTVVLSYISRTFAETTVYLDYLIT